MTDERFQSVCMTVFERFRWLVNDIASVSGVTGDAISYEWRSNKEFVIKIDGDNVSDRDFKSILSLMLNFVAGETKGVITQ